MADSDVGKLFVGGISRDTSDVTLKHHFSKYGDVSSSIIAKDRDSGLPRGFGFVTFSDASSVDFALRDQHFISGRMVEVKKAIPRNEQQSNTQQQQHPQLPHYRQQQQPPIQGYSNPMNKGSGRNNNNNNNDGNNGASNYDQSSHLKAKKIFVGGLSANLTEEEFKSYFEKFGSITDVVVMHDNNTNRPRGFGFITFDSEEVVEKVMRHSHHELGGKRVEVKKAVPRDATKSFINGQNSRFGGGRFSPAAGYPDDSNWVRGSPAYVNYAAQFPQAASYPGCYYGGYYGGGYTYGGYGFYGYGTPVPHPRSPMNGFGGMAYRPFPYGTGFYPTGNGGVALLGMFNGYNGVVDTGANVKQDHNVSGNNSQVHARDGSRQMNGARSDAVNSGLKTGKAATSSKKMLRTPDAEVQSKVTPTGQSS